VWIDYGDAGGVNDSPDGVFQPDEYVIVDQPLWGSDNLYNLASSFSYPFDTTSSAVQSTFGLPAIGVQPYAASGLQVVSFQIPAMSDVSCGKHAFARFRITKQPLNLFRPYNPAAGEAHVLDPCSWSSITGTRTYPTMTNSLKQPDPSLGEATDGGEVEDYPISFNSSCSLGIFGLSSLCFYTLNTASTFTANNNFALYTLPPPQTTVVNGGISLSAGIFSVSYSGPGSWPAPPFYVQVSDNNPSDPDNGNLELMQVNAITPVGPNYIWSVTRNTPDCTGNMAFDDGSVVALASPCQCQINAGQPLSTTFLNVSGTDPGIPCDPGILPHPPFDPVFLYAEQYPFINEVMNSGAYDLSGVVVHYTVPANAIFLSASVSQGTYTNVAGNVSFNLGTLQAGQTAQFGINFLPRTSGLITHQFDLAADQTLAGTTNYQVPNLVTIKPLLNVATGSNHTATLTWPNNDPWTLQQSTSLGGGWSNAPVQAPGALPVNQPVQFFRLTQP
jgi:hypothetical protein